MAVADLRGAFPHRDTATSDNSSRRAGQAAHEEERVRAKAISPPGHAAVLPDTNAHFLGENPQHVYSVRFDSRELWGADAEPAMVTAELYECYPEATP